MLKDGVSYTNETAPPQHAAPSCATETEDSSIGSQAIIDSFNSAAKGQGTKPQPNRSLFHSTPASMGNERGHRIQDDGDEIQDKMSPIPSSRRKPSVRSSKKTLKLLTVPTMLRLKSALQYL